MAADRKPASLKLLSAAAREVYLRRWFSEESLMGLVSMTGFAEAHGAHGTLRWRWEVKSVNGRGLDLRLRTPPGFDNVEPAARVLAGERFRRGNLQATLTLEPQEGARGLRIDPVALSAAV